ncbi:hypothetical protein ARMSODRAFT_976390 [Armillaria solidipes]|uniref:Uncharacterized protein n=1 Tax=Armillaria solidipes TaxID=1076256 RepID=A0A2H3BEN8_9AGAR|nr:hypothetical protein ARMSODRAFT_976390 [Armillaria solidipes]
MAFATAFYLALPWELFGKIHQFPGILLPFLSLASCHLVFLDDEPPPDDDDDDDSLQEIHCLPDSDNLLNTDFPSNTNGHLYKTTPPDPRPTIWQISWNGLLSRHTWHSAAVSKCSFRCQGQRAAAGKRLLAIYKLMERDAASTLSTPAGGRQISVAQSYMQENQLLSEYYLCAGSRLRAIPIHPRLWTRTQDWFSAYGDSCMNYQTAGAEIWIRIQAGDCCKTTPQLGRQEMIADLSMIANDLLLAYMGYRSGVEKALTLPRRLIFSRVRWSEGEFKHILDQDACKDAKIILPP